MAETLDHNHDFYFIGGCNLFIFMIVDGCDFRIITIIFLSFEFSIQKLFVLMIVDGSNVKIITIIFNDSKLKNFLF